MPKLLDGLLQAARFLVAALEAEISGSARHWKDWKGIVATMFGTRGKQQRWGRTTSSRRHPSLSQNHRATIFCKAVAVTTACRHRVVCKARGLRRGVRRGVCRQLAAVLLRNAVIGPKDGIQPLGVIAEASQTWCLSPPMWLIISASWQ